MERARECVKIGGSIRENGAAHRVMKITQGKRGKGGAFVKAKLKNLETGSTYEKTYLVDEMVEQVDIEKTKAAYSWSDGDTLFFMTNDTFEELPVPVALVENHAFLKEGEEFRVMRCEGKILGVELPTVMNYTVAAMDSMTNKATLDSGAVISVPDFVSVGDVIKANTEDGTYSGRA